MAVSNRTQLQKYTYITRECLEHARPLDLTSLKDEESRRLGLQIIDLLRRLSNKNIHYGEISPYRILRASPPDDSNE